MSHGKYLASVSRLVGAHSGPSIIREVMPSKHGAPLCAPHWTFSTLNVPKVNLVVPILL